MLDPHFERENQIALPPLGLLAPLAAGKTPAGPQALAATDVLRKELPRMLEERTAHRCSRGEGVQGRSRIVTSSGINAIAN